MSEQEGEMNPEYKGPESYQPATLNVRPIVTHLPTPETVSTTQKSSSVGSFVVRQTQPKPPTYNAPIGIPRRVDGGVRDTRKERAELEAKLQEHQEREEVLKQVALLLSDIKDLTHTSGELIKKPLDPATKAELFKAQENIDEAFSDVHENPTGESLKKLADAQDAFREIVEKAEQEASALPPEMTSAEKEAKLAKEVLELTFEVDPIVGESKELLDEVSDNTVRNEFQNDITRLEMLFVSLRRNPDESVKEDFLQLFDEFKKNLETVKDYVSKNPKPAPTPVAAPPVSVPAATQAPSSPAQAPKNQNILEVWPTSLFKVSRKDYKGWVFSRGGTNEEKLRDGREWDDIEKPVKSVLNDYRAFMNDANSSYRAKKEELFQDLISVKGDVIHELKQRLPLAAKERSEVLAQILLEKKEVWKKYLDEQKSKEELTKKKEEATKSLEQQKERYRSLQAWNLTPETKAFFSRLIASAESLKTQTEQDTKYVTDFYDAVKALAREISLELEKREKIETHNQTYSTGTTKGSILRPNVVKRVTLADGQKDTRTVQTKNGTVSVNEWIDKQEAEEQKRVEKELNKQLNTIDELYEQHKRMYDVDPEGYKTLFQNKEYVSGDTTKTVVDRIFAENGIVNEGREGEKKDPRVFMSSFGSVYSPEKKGMVTRGNFETKSMAKESYTKLQAQFINLFRAKESIAGKEILAKLKIFNNEQGGGFRDENEEKLYKLDTAEHKIRILISKLSKLAANDKNYDSQYEGVEREIAKYASEVETFKNSLEEQLARYNKAQEEGGVEAAPDAPEKKMEEKMGKVNALLEARKRNLANNPKYMKKGRIRALVLALATLTAAGTAYDSWVNKEGQAPEPTLKSSPETKKTWESYMHQDAEQKEYLADFRKLPTTDLVKKCLSSGNLDLPKEVCALTYEQLMDPNNPIAFLNDEQRLKLSQMVSMTENISQALDAPGEEWGRKTGKPVTLNSDRFAKGSPTLGDFFQAVRTKLAKVEQ